MVGVRFAWKADDEVRGQHDVGPRGADAVDQPQIVLRRVLAVHRLQNRVRPRLNRQMQIGHQLRHIAMRSDQVVGHVVRMAGRIADAVQPRDVCQPPDQIAQARRALAMPSVHVLAEQCDLAHAARHQIACLGQDAGGGAADLGAAGIRHHAERAEFIAAFLHGQEGGGMAARRGALRQVVELVLGREIGVDGRPLAARHRGQAVIGLRTDDQVDKRHAPDDLVTFGLRDAARDPDLEIRPLGLERLEPAQVGIQLLGRLLADVAGVQQHHVRCGLILGQFVTFRRHRFGHALAVIDVHLAAIGLDEQPLGALVGHGAGFRWDGR